MKFTELKTAEYRKFEQSHPYSNLYQEANRIELRKRMGWDIRALGLKDKNNKIVAAGLLLNKKGDAFIPMGPILDWADTEILKEFLSKLKSWAKAQKIYALEILPPVHIAFYDKAGKVQKTFDQSKIISVFEASGFNYQKDDRGINLRSNTWVATKDTSSFKSEDELLKSYTRRAYRYCPEAVYSKKITIKEVESKADIEKVAIAIEDSNDKNGLKSRPLDYYLWIKEIWKDKVHFYLATHAETQDIVAGHIFFDTPNEEVGFLAGTIQKYRNLNAMTVMEHIMFKRAMDLKNNRGNMYGLEGAFTPNNHLLAFKGIFNPVIEQYIGGFNIILNKPKYLAAKTLQKSKSALGRIKRMIKR